MVAPTRELTPFDKLMQRWEAANNRPGSPIPRSPRCVDLTEDIDLEVECAKAWAEHAYEVKRKQFMQEARYRQFAHVYASEIPKPKTKK
jgi:hypothetical protein